jgi:hypothetical protein
MKNIIGYEKKIIIETGIRNHSKGSGKKKRHSIKQY